MITGFQAFMEVDDGASNAYVKFAGLVEIGLPKLEANKYDATELDQKATDGTTPDGYEREEPTGTIKVGTSPAKIKYTKANFLRLQALVAKRGKNYRLTAPDDQTTPGTPAVLVSTFAGFVSMVELDKFEKNQPTMINFEITVGRQPAYT